MLTLDPNNDKSWDNSSNYPKGAKFVISAIVYTLLPAKDVLKMHPQSGNEAREYGAQTMIMSIQGNETNIPAVAASILTMSKYGEYVIIAVLD